MWLPFPSTHAFLSVSRDIRELWITDSQLLHSKGNLRKTVDTEENGEKEVKLYKVLGFFNCKITRRSVSIEKFLFKPLLSYLFGKLSEF